MAEICQRPVTSCATMRYGGETNGPAAFILYRECPKCGVHDTVYICAPCAEYIEEKKKKRSGEWRCLECRHIRDISFGLEILGKA